MWESSIYRFEEEISQGGKIKKVPFLIDVTYSAPRNLFDPGKALIGVFNKITTGKDPEKISILDFGAGKMRNTLWLLQKGFQVWTVEFEELKKRLPDAAKKWKEAEDYSNFNKVTFPKDFIEMDKKFDIILLINVVNVMPIPIERFALLSLCREKIKDKGMLLWHQWRGLATGQSKYSEDNSFIDGYLMGQKNHTFYVEHNREETFEILASMGFFYNKEMNLSKVPGNSSYSFIFNPEHEILIENTLSLKNIIKTKRDPDKIIPVPSLVYMLELYTKELDLTDPGPTAAHKYHRLAARIFYEIFRNQLKEPVIEHEINEGRGRIDITYKNRNKEGIFKNAKDLRSIPCPEIMVECKNYNYDHKLGNEEFSQIADRLSPQRGQLGFLLCRDKISKNEVLDHCRDRNRGGKNNYIIVLDDPDLIKLANYKLSDDDDESIDDFVDKKISEIVN